MYELGLLTLLHAVGFAGLHLLLKSGEGYVPEEKPLPERGGAQIYNEDDYWDGEEINYASGEIVANGGPTIRHPKNRDRAYSGSVERFHDGGR